MVKNNKFHYCNTNNSSNNNDDEINVVFQSVVNLCY